MSKDRLAALLGESFGGKEITAEAVASELARIRYQHLQQLHIYKPEHLGGSASLDTVVLRAIVGCLKQMQDAKRHPYEKRAQPLVGEPRPRVVALLVISASYKYKS